MNNKKIALDIQSYLMQAIEDQIRELRVTVLTQKETCSSILFTSTYAGEGKTTISLFLADALGKCGKNVVWIDCNFYNSEKIYSIQEETQKKETQKKQTSKKKIPKRKRQQVNTRTEDNTKNWGLSDYLTDLCEVEEIVYLTQEEGLHVIPSGKADEKVSDCIAKDKFNQLMDTLKERFDYVIIDSSSMSVSTDGKVLTGKCDGTVYVITYNKVNCNTVKEKLVELRKYKGNVIGAVLNRSSSPKQKRKRSKGC